MFSSKNAKRCFSSLKLFLDDFLEFLFTKTRSAMASVSELRLLTDGQKKEEKNNI